MILFFVILAQKAAKITLQKKVEFVWSLQTSLLFIVGDLLKVGSVSVALRVSDK